MLELGSTAHGTLVSTPKQPSWPSLVCFPPWLASALSRRDTFSPPAPSPLSFVSARCTCETLTVALGFRGIQCREIFAICPRHVAFASSLLHLKHLGNLDLELCGPQIALQFASAFSFRQKTAGSLACCTESPSLDYSREPS